MNANQNLNAYWHGDPGGRSSWGCAGDEATCASLYGNTYNSGEPQDPAGLPDAAGLPDFVPGTIQAGIALSVNSPTLTNTGNVIGQTVALSGSQLVNGLTNPNVFTPPPAIAGQVISLGPPAVSGSAATTMNSAGLVTNMSGQPVSITGTAGVPRGSQIGATTVGKPVTPPVQTVTGQPGTVTYLVNSPASALARDLSPSALLAQLPASLQPSTTQFYYDPYTQAQQVEQAALEATGRSSFYSDTSATDNTSQASIDNQDTAALYAAALQYAEQNNVALGTQLSQAQLALVNQPMLWYVEETVPEPGCSATGNGACPTVQALMPEVLLPQNYAEVNADGEISGTNVSLNYSDSVLNTGSVTATNLSVDTGTLTNEQRSTNVGTIYQMVQGDLYQTTGTEVQQGGFMSAASYSLTADTINQIGGALQVTNADGSVNEAATSQLLTNLKSQLGGSFTQSTVGNHLDTVDLDSTSWFDQLWMMVVIAGLSIMSAGAASAAIGAAAGATAGSGSTFAAAGGTIGAGVGNAAISAAIGGMTNSALGQSAFGNGSFSVGAMFEAGASAFLTAGLTNGLTYQNGALGFTTEASKDSLAALAGVQSVGNVMLPGATSSTGNDLQAVLALAAEAGIQSAVQTGIEGGSFLTNLGDDAVADGAAAGAYAIGSGTDPLTLENVLAHAVLGCAAGAASGQGCGGGAIGGAVSAALTPATLDAIDPTHAPLTTEQTAFATAVSMLFGGSVAGLLGQNASAAATAAANETLDNSTKHWAANLAFCILCFMGVQPGSDNPFEASGSPFVDDPSLGVSEKDELDVEPPIYTTPFGQKK
jgi:filamentous hemagglutinin